MWWHWRDGRPLHPVVVGFEHGLEMLVELRIMARHGDCSSEELELRGRIGNRVLAGGVTDFPDELPGDRLLLLWPDDPLPYGGAVRKWTMPIQFDYSVDGGRRWHMLRYAGPTAWYVMPSAWPYVEKPYDLGFEKVARYAAGAVDDSTICRALTAGIDGEILYKPEEEWMLNFHALKLYDFRKGMCMPHAMLLEHLARTADIDARVVYTWGGADRSWIDNYEYSEGYGSFQILLDRHDDAPANPHFTFHALTWGGSHLYDPSYGKPRQGIPEFAEVCARYSEGVLGEFHVPPRDGEVLRVPGQQTHGELPWEQRFIPYRCGH